MQSLTTILAVAIGFHLAVALLLVAHYVELRAAYVLWWLAGVAALAARAVVDLGALAPPVPLGLVLLPAALQLAGAGFFLTGSVARDPRAGGVTVVGTLGFGALVLAVVAALLLTRPGGPSLALAHGIVGTAAGLAFLLAAEGYRRAERILDDAGALFIFAGLGIAGLNFMGWAWIAQTPSVAAAAELLSGVFILVFGAGGLMRSVQRARRLVILSQLTTALHRAGTVHELLRDVLERAGDLLELRSGWVFLRRPGTDATNSPRPITCRASWRPTARRRCADHAGALSCSWGNS